MKRTHRSARRIARCIRNTVAPGVSIGSFSILFAATLLMSLPVAARDGDSRGMTEVARLFQGLTHRIEYRAPYAIVAMDSGLVVYDWSDRDRPYAVGHQYLPSAANDLELVGDVAYVAAGEAGLFVIDVSDRARPAVLGHVPITSDCEVSARAVTVAAGIAYVAESSSDCDNGFGLQLVDVSDPFSPVEIGRLDLAAGAGAVAVRGETAFVGLDARLGGRHGIALVDVSNSQAPVEVTDRFLEFDYRVNQIVIDGDIAYVGTGFPMVGAVMAIDVTDERLPVELDRLWLKNSVEDLSIDGDRLFLATRENGLQVVDVSNPTDLVLDQKIALGEVVVAVATRGDETLVGTRSGNGASALVAVETLISARYRVLGGVDQGEAIGVAAEDGRAYLLRRHSLEIFDSTNPESAVWLSSWRGLDAGYSSIAAENSIVAIGSARRVHLLDVSSDTNPVAVGTISLTAGIVGRLRIHDGVLYVIVGTGFESFDITDPAQPRLLGGLPTPGWATDLAVLDRFGYLLFDGTLTVVDLSVPGRPRRLGHLSIDGEFLSGVAVRDSLAVVTGRNGLYTIDVSDPANPVMLGMSIDGAGIGVDFIGRSAAVAAGERGVRIIDIDRPEVPVLIAHRDTAGVTVDVAGQGLYLFAASSTAQHRVVRCDTCSGILVARRHQAEVQRTSAATERATLEADDRCSL